MKNLILGAAIASLSIHAGFADNMNHDMHNGDHDSAMMAMTIPGSEVEHGALAIQNAFTFATLPNQPAGGGFMLIENHGEEGDRLISAHSDIADSTQIHEMRVENDRMTMKEVPEGLEIPAGERLALEPGGYHIMFIGLHAPIADGDEIAVSLTFEKAGEVVVPFTAILRQSNMSHQNKDHKAK